MNPEVKFTPLNDQVLIKMDVRRASELAIETTKPTVLPSGTVVAVGKGVYTPGAGWAGSQVAQGDHVAVDIHSSPILRMPISHEKYDIYIVISESLLLGKLEGADTESPWYNADPDKAHIH